MTLQITKVNAPQDKLKKKAPYSMDPIGTTTHETGNIATAMAEISYMLGNNSSTGYHFAVDDTRAVQGLPLNRNAFHSGDGSTGRGNRKTIGVEHCYNWNGKTTTKNDKKYNPLYQQAIKNGVELQAQLFIQHPQWGEPKAGVNMFRHYDHNRKNCPQRIIEEGYWNTYVALVRARYLELRGVKTEPVKTVSPKPSVKPAANPAAKKPESIVDYLNSIKVDSSPTNRKKIAAAHGISNYSGTAAQNIQLLDLVKKNGVTPKKPTPAKPAAKKYPLPDATYWVKKPLFSGTGVRQVQEALASIYFYPEKGAKNNGVDGYYGAKTADAVKRFQSVNGLKPDGEYGPKTKKALDKKANK